MNLSKVAQERLERAKQSTLEVPTIRVAQISSVNVHAFSTLDTTTMRLGYTSNDYSYFNNYLRGFSDDLGPVSTSTISDIDSALS